MLPGRRAAHVWLFVSVIVCRPRVIYEVDVVSCWGPYFTGDRVQLNCVIPASFMQRGCRVAEHLLMCQPILTYLSLVDHPALASDAIGHIPASLVFLSSASMWSHRMALFPYPATDDGGDSLLDYSIQNDNKNLFCKQESIFKNKRFQRPCSLHRHCARAACKSTFHSNLRVFNKTLVSSTHLHAPGTTRLRSTCLHAPQPDQCTCRYRCHQYC